MNPPTAEPGAAVIASEPRGNLDERLPPFAALRAFEAVFRVGGIRKAAAVLGVDHAVVSRHLKTLEQWMGLPLINRMGNRVSLTREGEQYLARISAALAELRRATWELSNGADGRPFRICCVPGFSIQWLSEQLAVFAQENPDATIELKPTDTRANLAIFEADADIRYYLSEDLERVSGPGLRSFELARPEVIAVASPDLAARIGVIDTVAAILALPMLHEESDREWKTWLSLNGIEVPTPLPGLRCWHAHLALAAARQGRGVALANRFLIASDLDRGTLVRIDWPQARPAALGAYVLFAREDRWMAPVLVRLRQFLKASADTFQAAER
jgi:DNA-binding transcriptional LysR family regulator